MGWIKFLRLQILPTQSLYNNPNIENKRSNPIHHQLTKTSPKAFWLCWDLDGRLHARFLGLQYLEFKILF